MESIHHIFPKSRGGTDDEMNLRGLDLRFHQRFHALFDNLTPDEQIASIVELASTSLTRDFKARILETLHRGPEYTYEDGVYVPRRFQRRR